MTPLTTPVFDTALLQSAPVWKAYADERLGDAALEILRGNLQELLAQKKSRLDHAATATPTHTSWQQKAYDEFLSVTDADLRGIIAALNGDANADATAVSLFADKRLVEIFELDLRKRLAPQLGIKHLFRWLRQMNYAAYFWTNNKFQDWLSAQLKQNRDSVDLRALVAAWQSCGAADAVNHVASAVLTRNIDNNGVVDRLPAECIWPFFVEHPQCIDQGLGIAPKSTEVKTRAFTLDATLKALVVFPALQPQWLAKILDIALGDAKTYRALAVAALLPLKNLGELLQPYLRASQIGVRAEAANLIADIQHLPAIPALVNALKMENRELARAAFLASLERLGEDISSYLTPNLLLAEALKGLKAKLPPGLEWFNFAALPACKWNDGSVVEPDILRWWVVFTCKLKEPGGNALVTRYLHLLAPESRAAFSRSVLFQFIAEDSRQLPLVPGMSTYDKWIASREYITSAIGEKGILALTACTPAQEYVAQIMQFMRDHHLHRAQIEALLEASASSDEPLIIQMLIGVARRHRTASVQLKAQVLIAQIAEKNGWTSDELSDRTTPTAGLNDAGKVELQFGTRTFYLVLDTAMKFALQNDEGNPISALPEPRSDDDAELAKAAKAQLSTSKKELKLVLDSQATRLQEAMCVSRLWPVARWREYLHEHPIVGRLIQRLLWIEYDKDGLKTSVFRPSEDGSLINIDDTEIALAPNSTVRLAHRCLLDETQTARWVAHFKDYKVVPLFAQLTRKVPDLVLPDITTTAIATHQGWMSDTFTLRSAFTKLGYQRAATEDGGFFELYVKTYSAIGIKVRIEFSGNTLPEANIPAALKTLSFETDHAKSWDERFMPLHTVPPVLLAEAHADYLAVAQVGTGFDAQWEDKVRF